MTKNTERKAESVMRSGRTILNGKEKKNTKILRFNVYRSMFRSTQSVCFSLLFLTVKRYSSQERWVNLMIDVCIWVNQRSIACDTCVFMCVCVCLFSLTLYTSLTNHFLRILLGFDKEKGEKNENKRKDSSIDFFIIWKTNRTDDQLTWRHHRNFSSDR